jgi:hypothetical protein
VAQPQKKDHSKMGQEVSTPYSPHSTAPQRRTYPSTRKANPYTPQNSPPPYAKQTHRFDELRDAYDQAGIPISPTMLWTLVDQWMSPLPTPKTANLTNSKNDADVNAVMWDVLERRADLEAQVEELIEEIAGEHIKGAESTIRAPR